MHIINAVYSRLNAGAISEDKDANNSRKITSRGRVIISVSICRPVDICQWCTQNKDSCNVIIAHIIDCLLNATADMLF